ncbi:hypothetical protein C0995_013310, partial [Termitomyces sp. Mi166
FKKIQGSATTPATPSATAASATSASPAQGVSTHIPKSCVKSLPLPPPPLPLPPPPCLIQGTLPPIQVA